MSETTFGTIKEIETNFKKCFNTGEKQQLPYAPLDVFRQIINKYDDSIEICDFETNGWQIDFWWHFKVKDVKYCFAGCVWFGKYNISKTEDE